VLLGSVVNDMPFVLCIITLINCYPQNYIGTSKEMVILGNRKRMSPLHASSSLLCEKTNLCSGHTC
jgi:hypothetical protein